jgi:hypothetical protein
MGGGRRRHPPGQLHHRRPLVRRRGDVEEDQLVRSLGVVVRRQLDGIAGIADEPRALTTRPSSTSMHGMTRL